MTVAEETCPLHADLATHAIVASEELAPQFASCIHCVEGLRAWRDLRALGGSLDWTPPDADRAARVRARVVGTVSSRSSVVPRSFRRWLTSAAVGMAAVCSALLVAFVATHREKRESRRDRSRRGISRRHSADRRCALRTYQRGAGRNHPTRRGAGPRFGRPPRAHRKVPDHDERRGRRGPGYRVRRAGVERSVAGGRGGTWTRRGQSWGERTGGVGGGGPVVGEQ